jgi:hypothetical protein
VSVAGDIILTGADCTEAFPVEDPAALEPGTVMVIGPGERLRHCSQPYDRRVAGVISGAADHKAGHAMKAADPRRAFGAVIGKALRPLPAGRGLVPILVALQ